MPSARSPYNFFYREERQRIQNDFISATGSRLPSGQIAKIVVARWKSLDRTEKARYQVMASLDKSRNDQALLRGAFRDEAQGRAVSLPFLNGVGSNERSVVQLQGFEDTRQREGGDGQLSPQMCTVRNELQEASGETFG